jgi:hypothetical protein
VAEALSARGDAAAARRAYEAARALAERMGWSDEVARLAGLAAAPP